MKALAMQHLRVVKGQQKQTQLISHGLIANKRYEIKQYRRVQQMFYNLELVDAVRTLDK